MKRLLINAFFVFLYVFIVSQPASALDLQIGGAACLLADAQTGEVLYSQNAESACYPASVTKLMTLTLALEAVKEGKFSLADIVTTSEEAASMGGSQVYLYGGEQRTLKDMLIAVAVGSGNDAAYAVAEFIGGSYDNFIKMMNDKAKELGMTGTHFVNPHGLHDAEHFTTAADLNKLAYYSLQNTDITDFTSIYEYQFRPSPKELVLWNTNRLLKWYDGTIGLKTGFTKEAGYNLVSCAEKNGMRLICVVLGVTERNGHFSESMKLLNYGFNNYEFVTVYDAESRICSVPVEFGEAESVSVILKEKAGILQKKGEKSDITARIIIDENICAPITAGEILGKLIILKNEQELGSYDLAAENNVEKAGFATIFNRILRHIIFSS